MGPPTNGTWGALEAMGDSLTGEGFSVRARTQNRPDELWINVRLPDGSWSYLVIGSSGAVLASNHGQTKARAYLAALEARGTIEAAGEDESAAPRVRELSETLVRSLDTRSRSRRSPRSGS